MVVDVFTYNGEADILEIHLNVLNDFVDQFIIVEAPTTFSGKPKPLYYEQQRNRFERFANKIRYFVIEENYSYEELQLAATSPNTVGADHWKREFLQKESIKKALTHLDDEDIVYIGDVDEIWNPNATKFSIEYGQLDQPVKLKLKVYAYYLNNESSESFWGTIVSRYKWVKNECLNHLRTNARKSYNIAGLHFTSIGGPNEVRRKLSDSYTRESYWTEEVENNLERNVKDSRDFLGRNFTYSINETYWPEYLRDNRDKYAHLLR